jgi:hypothetical protein
MKPWDNSGRGLVRILEHFRGSSLLVCGGLLEPLAFTERRQTVGRDAGTDFNLVHHTGHDHRFTLALGFERKLLMPRFSRTLSK